MFSFRKRGLVLIGTLAAVVAFAVPGTAMASTVSTTSPAQSGPAVHAERVAVTRAAVSREAPGVIPLTGSSCNPDILEAASECTTVTGSGLYIDSISGVTFSNVVYTLDDLHIEIYGPQGHIFNCAQFNLGGGGKSEPCLWVNPDGGSLKEPAGDYCSRVWQYNGSGYTVLSAECVNVHA